MTTLVTYIHGIYICPKYQCVNGTDKTCASLEVRPDNRIVNLTASCQEGEQCNVNFPEYFWLANLYNKNQTFHCIPSTNSTLSSVRLPGEDCTKDGECVHDPRDPVTGKCVNGKCSGHSEGETCKDHTGCLKGLYCDRGSKTCQKQKAKDSDCVTSYECINSVLCHQGKCNLEPFSLPLGSQVSTDDRDMDMWKCSMAFTHNYTCTMLNQKDTKQTYVPCNPSENCIYNTNEGDEINNMCDCGYNSNGQGYCMVGQNKSK
jgi:hypothetical protein